MRGNRHEMVTRFFNCLPKGGLHWIPTGSRQPPSLRSQNRPLASALATGAKSRFLAEAGTRNILDPSVRCHLLSRQRIPSRKDWKQPATHVFCLHR